MCLICTDIDDLHQNLPEEKMPEPWNNLKDEILSILLEETRGFSSELKDAARSFLQDQAVVIAKEKWRHLHAETEEERNIAASNLRHLYGQIGAEIARLQLVTTERAGALLERVLSTTIRFALKIAPTLFG
jgi:hypothetical protein